MAERARNHTKFAGLLDSLTDLEKVQAAEKVAVTMNTPGWDFLVSLLEIHRTKRLAGLVHGPVREQAGYAEALAEVRGIEMAMDAGPTVLHVAEQAERELTKREGAS